MNEKITALRMPLQAAPVERTITHAPMTTLGVDASFSFSDILSGVKTAAGIAGQFAPVLAGLL